MADDYSAFQPVSTPAAAPVTVQQPAGPDYSSFTPVGNTPGDAMGVPGEAWAKVMEEEGDTPNPTRNKEYQSIYGASSSQYWPGRSQEEDAAFNALHQYGAHSPEGIAALQNFWQSMTQGVDISGVNSTGLKEMMLADIQHRGGKAMVAAAGDPMRYNDMDEADAINAYSQARQSLWPGNPDRVARERNWAMSKVPGSTGDYSAFDPVTPAEPAETQDAQTTQQSPADGVRQPPDKQKPDASNPFDVGKFLQTYVGSGTQQILKGEQGAAEAQLHPETRQVLPYEEQVQQAKEDAILKNPNTSQEEADNIAHQRNQRLAYIKANAQQNVEETTGALKEAESRVDPDYEATPAGQTAKILGTGTVGLIPALTGPAAPLTMAEQMGAQSYAEEKDRATETAKKAHPEWSDDQVEAAATQAAENASRTSAESGVVLSLLPVPKIGRLLARLVERVGMRGAYMTVAGAVQDISSNAELQKIDPNQALYDGVLARMPANFIAGAAFELPGTIGEAVGEFRNGTKTPVETPEPRPAEGPGPAGETQPEAPAPETAEPSEGEKGAVVEENGELPPEENEPTVAREPASPSAEPEGIPSEPKQPQAETKPASNNQQLGVDLPVDERGRPTKAWDDLVPEEKTAFVQQVRDTVQPVIDRYQPLFDQLGVKQEPEVDGTLSAHLAIQPRDDGSITLKFNPEGWAENLWESHRVNGTDWRNQARINSNLREELIHAAYVSTVRDRWQPGRYGLGFASFLKSQTKGIFKSLTEAADKTSDPALRKMIRDTLGASADIYAPNQGLSAYALTHEFLRQLIQIRERTPLSEGFFHKSINKALAGIRYAYESALGLLRRMSRRVQEFPELNRAIVDTEGRLAEIDQAVGRRAATSPIDAAIESVRSQPAERPLSVPGESLILPNREVVEKQPHTDELVKALDNYRAEEGELHGQLSVLNRRFRELKKANPNLSKEVDQIGRTVADGGRIPANASPEAREWLRIANNGAYREIADRMRAGGFKVVLPDGSTRPFAGAPSGVTPFPRIMRPDVADVLSKPIEDANGNLTPAARKLFQEGRNTINKNTGKPYFQTPDDLKPYVRDYNLQKRQGPLMSNLERARTVKFPSFFYSYSPEAMLGSLAQQSSEIARLNAFGQKIGRQPDLFDKTVEEINNDLKLSGNRKQAAVNAIDSLRNNVYGLNRRNALIRFVRGASSASLAGSPHTSAKIGLGMLFNVPAYRGLGRTLQGVFSTAFRPGTNFAELRRLGLSSDQMANLSDDPYAKSGAQQKATNIFTGVLRLAGHALAQDIGKSVTARASRAWLEGYAIPRLQADPTLSKAATRMVAQDISRRGLDPADFGQRTVDPDLKDRFVREDVQDVQTAYRPEDYPGWASTQYGSVAFQFGHWAYNAARTIIRDSILPLASATRNGDVTLAGRYALRLAGISLAAAGAGEAWRELDKLFGRQSNVATVGEIMQAFSRGDPEGAQLLVNRLTQDVVGSSVIGMFGDVYNWASATLHGTADTTHFFNPSTPAAVGWLKVIQDAINEAAQQGGKLSNRQIANFTGQLAGLVKGWYDLANTAGAPLPGHSEAAGRREEDFVRSRLNLFYEQHPEWDKREKVSSFAGNVHTPYLQNLNEALLSGNVQDARRIVNSMRIELRLTPQQLTNSLRESVDSHRPIPTGKGGEAFTQWAKRTLTPDELARANYINALYARTALASGALGR